MKQHLAILASILLSAFGICSCTKQLMEDLGDIQKNIDSLRAANARLRNEAAALGNLVGSDEPVIVLTTFEDNAGKPRSIKDTFSIKGNSGFSNSMEPRDNGLFFIKVARLGNNDGEEGGQIQFVYDPATRQAKSIIADHYWDDYDPYGDEAYYYPELYDRGIMTTVNVKHFNPTTGDISFTFSGSADGTYTGSNTMEAWVPNRGKPMSTTLSFTGKLVKNTSY